MGCSRPGSCSSPLGAGRGGGGGPNPSCCCSCRGPNCFSCTNSTGDSSSANASSITQPRCRASACRAAQVGSADSARMLPSTHSAFLARVMATFRRRVSARKPTPPPPRPVPPVRTQLRMTTSTCLPWKLSTVSTRTSPASSGPSRRLSVSLIRSRCERYGVMTATATGDGGGLPSCSSRRASCSSWQRSSQNSATARSASAWGGGGHKAEGQDLQIPK